MMNRYNELLTCLYTGQTPDWLPSTVLTKYQANSKKRILDICQRLWDGWPQSSFYANAIFKEEYLFGVCSNFPLASMNTSTVMEATQYALEAWLATLSKGKIHEIFKYESLFHPNMREEYTGSLKNELRERAGLPHKFTLRTFEYDILAFVKKVKYFQAVHAPDVFVRNLEPPTKSTVLVVYQKDKNVIAQNVTLLIKEIEAV